LNQTYLCFARSSAEQMAMPGSLRYASSGT
jgi:hypothetical protein